MKLSKHKRKPIYVYDKTGKFIEKCISLQDFTDRYVKASIPSRQLNKYGVVETSEGFFGSTERIGRTGVRAFKKLEVLPVRSRKKRTQVPVVRLSKELVKTQEDTKNYENARVVVSDRTGEKIAVFKWEYANKYLQLSEVLFNKLKEEKRLSIPDGLELELKEW